ncbi:hypothetical protein [Sphaerotilus sp.]|jgi:hypothetical protein|uniref:hypothetical protein n=1 Tax=Sphaerotilus sp. TaxID=2093942 RepID=UPI0025E3111D|nr:hypothetical protein [Sphaerotilus sp.]
MPSSDAATRRSTGRMVALLLCGTLVFLVAALVTPWLLQTLRGGAVPAATATAPTAGLPWQIERRPDGSSRVFGLDLGHGTLQQAAHQWPEEPLQLALVRDAQGVLALEGYLERVDAGFVQGKLVLSGTAAPATLQGWADRATARAPQPSGTWRLTLSPSDHTAALAAPIAGLVFLPAARFDASTAVARFGPATERRTTQDGTVHLLYPEQGVVVALDPQGRTKPVLQYVAPSDFQRLRAPLLR